MNVFWCSVKETPSPLRLICMEMCAVFELFGEIDVLRGIVLGVFRKGDMEGLRFERGMG